MFNKVQRVVFASVSSLMVSALVWAEAQPEVTGIFSNIGDTIMAILKGAGIIAGSVFCIAQIVFGLNTKQPSKVVGGVVGLIIVGSLVAIVSALTKVAQQ